MMIKTVNSVLSIPTNFDDFFYLWIKFLQPFHKLTEREMEVLSLFLKKRYILSKDIKSESLLNDYLFSEKIKKEIREELNISPQHFQVVMSKLRRALVIEDKRVNPRFIPKFEEKEQFKILLILDPTTK